MVVKTVLTCDGVTFASIAELAQAYKLHPSKVARRLRNGWTTEQAVGVHDRKRLGHPNVVTFNGMQYRDLVELANAFGLDPRNLRARLKYGYNLEDAIQGNFRPRTSGVAQAVTFRGQHFDSYQALGKAYGQKASNVLRRLGRGWTLEQALQIAPSPPRFRNFEGHARETKWKEARTSSEGKIEPIPDQQGFKLYLITNLVNRRQYVGITIGNLSQRLKQHFSAARRGRKAPLPNAIRAYGEDKFIIELIRDDARTFDELQSQEIDEIARRDTIKSGYNVAIGGSLGTSKPVNVAGQMFASRAQAAEHYGIDQFSFTQRIRKLGWTPEEAAGLVEKNWRGKAREVVIAGEIFESIRSAASHYGVSFKKVYDRYSQKGWTLEQALGLESPPGNARYAGKKVRLWGVDYESIAQAAKAAGVLPSTFALRLSRGLSPEQAAEGKSISVFGVRYSSIRSAAIALGLDDHSLRRQIRLGLKPEDAVVKLRKRLGSA